MRRRAELDYDRCVRGHACLTNDDAVGTTLCTEDHDGYASIL